MRDLNSWIQNRNEVVPDDPIPLTSYPVVMLVSYIGGCVVILYTRKNIFQTIFLYSLCPNLEGIKDALCYKFRRPTIGKNCSAVCTNKGGHRDAFSNERREAPRVSRGLLSMQATCHRASSEARDEVCSLS